MKAMLAVHKWFGLATLLTVLLAAVTGILLAHGRFFRLDKARVPLPGDPAPPDAFALLEVAGAALAGTKEGVYRGEAGAWRRVLPAPTKRLERHGSEVLALGKEGLFSSVDQGRTWRAELEQGEAAAVSLTETGLVAATETGVYRRQSGGWTRLASFEGHGPDVRGILASGPGLLLATREGVLSLGPDGALSPAAIPADGRGGTDLKKLVNGLHTGEAFGGWFVVVVDATAAAMILLSISGLYIWYKPWKARRLAASRRMSAARLTPVMTGSNIEARQLVPEGAHERH